MSLREGFPSMGGSTSSAENATNRENPITFLTATSRIQRMGLKQRSKRLLVPAALRRSITAEHAAAVSRMNDSGLKGMSFDERMSQSERLPLQTPEQRELTYDGTDAGSTTGDGTANNNNNNFMDASFPEMPEIYVVQYATKAALIDIVCCKFVSVFLLVTPVAIWANFHNDSWSPAWIFWLNFVVMVPLAAMLGDFTEELALHTNQTIGGLINATFGNAVEVVVAIQALVANEFRVVQASMLGSIFSNLLLVLGCCFFFGGLYYKEQQFNSAAATSNMGLLALSSIALVLPTPFAEYYNLEDEHVLKISRVSAIFLMFMYLQLLFFQLHTHVHIFEDVPVASTPNNNNKKDDNAEDDEEEKEEEEVPSISLAVAIAGLFCCTALVTYFSEYLVASIDGYTASSGISRTFVGLIILPIVGNAVEHITAVSVAIKDKMDLSMGVAVGSCTQISLFVVPLTVLVGWAVDKPMTLNFPHFEIILYVLSVITVR
ncbi:Ca(2+)/H(+) antiporter [Seminavis robusta]|uniref:Ca(2+)/H(+) antiporter n=1 Tax=Seminavis robusta TaxID=568900 RepID=A0A9N8DS65_9STRA|nr:Ca(2+)/H(+) antiporter [Seminavis robusta]|eukprot:Sro331_g119170.1 Ca(2+)/H(+) antiporter (490) ;mRNA; r:45805-47274